MSAHLTISVTDACGSRRAFEAGRASLDCGAGLLEFKARCPTYCRKFDDAVLRIFQPAEETVLALHNGTAALTATAVHILCEKFQESGEPAGLGA